jgi:CMP-N-acetylneuraminic acid synthetase
LSDAEPSRVNAIVIPRADPPGFPGRNTYPLFGRPLITWVLEALRHSRRVTGVFVSTRDEALTAVLKKAGFDLVPRPEELDNDRVSRVDVMRHAVTWLYRERFISTDIVLGVRATIPELRSRDIDNGIQFMELKRLRELLSMGADCVQNDHLRFISNRALFNASLSDRIGVMKTEYIDVRSSEDVAAIINRYGSHERFQATRE